MLKTREILIYLIKLINIPEAVILYGARQVGKTSIMKLLVEHLKKEISENVFFADLENDNLKKLFNKGLNEIIEFLKSKGIKEKAYIFIDEIQYLDNPTSLIKQFYDHYKNRYKLFVSGSSNIYAKNKIKQSLVGRAVDVEIQGLTFTEYLDFRNIQIDINTKSDILISQLRDEFIKYTQYGFYPQIILTDDIQLKNLYIKNIVDRYIYKDVRDIANIRDIEKFNNLIKIIAHQCGSLLNKAELSNTLGINKVTLYDFLNILEDTYIINLIRPYHTNIRTELSKMPKVYLQDNGILNYLRFNTLECDVDGKSFENAIHSLLNKLLSDNPLYFWRSTNKQEIDFVIILNKPYAFEVKLNSKGMKFINFISFNRKYKNAEKFVITLNKQENKYNIKNIFPWELNKLLL